MDESRESPKTVKKCPIIIDPLVNIKFNDLSEKICKSAIVIENQLNTPVVFKIKTTVPKNYSVKPMASFIEPLEKFYVDVTYNTKNPKKTPKQKFLIQVISLTENYDKEASITDLFNDSDLKENMYQHRLYSIFESDESNMGTNAPIQNHISQRVTELNKQAKFEDAQDKPDLASRISTVKFKVDTTISDVTQTSQLDETIVSRDEISILKAKINNLEEENERLRYNLKESCTNVKSLGNLSYSTKTANATEFKYIYIFLLLFGVFIGFYLHLLFG
ncbi:Vesicle-associated membrane protein/synaptobrevin-binding protein [Intoshia linei]|uniref:Vesicle-associated membrane protein/synaptobrevin-binding protein n=1 Tax=Intoshia linei TaxID=1819745 RepID=A0A177B972_9BILA|nr:Vesicle-associated membrane protein/synaptobrevin-binding protein [Intoshia linei]